MARELAITLYLFVFQIIFYTCKLFPQKKKTVFVASFGDNVVYTIKEIEKQTNDQVVILKTSQCKTDFDNASSRIIIDFKMTKPISWLQSIYHLATSQHIFVDNYFGFLAVTNFHPNVKCIQLWHAAGAIKQFGLKDPSIANRSHRANKRFQRVYHRFDHVVVGSEKMAMIFRDSFQITNEQILRTGIPRSDFFFNNSANKLVEQSLREQYPIINEKKVILYAPTYRDNQLNVADIHLDIDKMYRELQDEYVLFLRLHPAINGHFQNNHPEFVYNVSSYHDINHLLLITDVLISDYSSIPFEFSLLNRPMIFFAYDLDEYALSRGFWEDYHELVPGPVVKDTTEIVEVIMNDYFTMDKVTEFAKQWNQYSKGHSSERLVQAIVAEDNKEYKIADHI